MTNGILGKRVIIGSDLVERIPTWALYLLLALISLAIYGQSIGFPLIWDSAQLITENPSIRAFDPIGAFAAPTTIGASGYSGQPFEQGGYYRPVLQLLFSGWYQLAGESSALWHGLALAVNVVTVMLAFRLMQAMKQPQWAAFAIVLLFAVNPGRVSAITLVYGLSNQFFGVFILSAFLCWVREERWWSLGFFLLALGCRETAVLYPLIALIWELLFKKENRPWVSLGAHVGLVAIYLVARHLVGATAGLTTLSPVVWLNCVVVILSSHLHSLAWPSWGVRYYPLEEFATLSLRALAGYGVLIGGLLALLWGWKRNRWVAFWLLWFGVWISVHFNVGQFGEFLMDEKNNYLLALSFAALFVSLAKLSREYALVLCLAVVVAQGGLSAWRASHWHDPITFYSSAIEQAPQFATLHYNLGNAHVDAEAFPEAEEAFLKTVELAPGHSMAWNNIGNIRYMRQDLPGAARAWQNSFNANPMNMMAAHNLSLAYSRLGDQEAAALYYSRYLKLKALQTAPLPAQPRAGD